MRQKNLFPDDAPKKRRSTRKPKPVGRRMDGGPCQGYLMWCEDPVLEFDVMQGINGELVKIGWARYELREDLYVWTAGEISDA